MDTPPGTDTHRALTPITVLTQRVCSRCVHGLIGPFGVRCGLLDVAIWDERDAEQCEAWEAA